MAKAAEALVAFRAPTRAALILAVAAFGCACACADATAVPDRFFAAWSFWNKPLPARARLDPQSPALAGALASEVLSEFRDRRGPWINTTAYSVPIYTVGPAQPTVAVRLVHSEEATLAAAWRAVPLPANAKPAAGSERLLVVWQPSADRMWEFRGLKHTKRGWTATWGGAIQHVSSNRGAYGPEAWSGARPWWGADGSSFAIAGGLITFADLARGRIDHALVMAMPNVREAIYAAPAERTDGTSGSPLSMPEGAHLRLDPTLDLASLHLPPLTLMIARAAQRYGILVGASAPNVAFYAQDPGPTGADPYAGAAGYFGGKGPNQLLAAFPWQHLQLLKMTLHHNGRPAAPRAVPRARRASTPARSASDWPDPRVFFPPSDVVSAALIAGIIVLMLAGLAWSRLRRVRGR